MTHRPGGARHALLVAALLAAACATPPDEGADPSTPDGEDAGAPDTEAPPTCGDGVVDPGEACDDGDANSDTAPDACRTDCTLPRCGDGVADMGEACDDGNRFGGDGCTPACEAESGPFEQEPNDAPRTATPVEPGVAVFGNLPEYDRDCYAIDVPDNGFVAARATGVDGRCPPQLSLRLVDPEGEEIAEGYPEDTDRCGVLDPQDDPDLVYLDAGLYTVCAEGLLRSEVRAYRISVDVGDDSCIGGPPPSPDQDLDGDGLADPCDSDDDDDGLADTVDNCPRAPNHGAGIGFDTADAGYVRQWLLLGPFEDYPTGPGGSCDPSADHLTGTDDATADPRLGDLGAEDVAWFAHLEGLRRTDYLRLFSVSPYREVYAAAWVESPDARTAEITWGADDGSRLWFGGAEVYDDPDCGGVVTDQYAATVDLEPGWNRLLVKVRDHGGGWGLELRLKHPDGTPMTDLATSLEPGAWYDDQRDLDADGRGDACDRYPADPTR